MYTIEQKLVKVNKYSRPGIKQLAIRAIVVHWTANYGASAMNHYNYFNNGGGGRYAGCHYFVDKERILLIVPENEVCYHANENGRCNISYLKGLKSGSYVGQANVATIGIEMCVEKNGSYHPETLKKTKWLIRHLMNKYKLGLDRVIRHNDITGKACPGNLLTSASWNNFKAGIPATTGGSSTVSPTTPPTTTGEYRVEITVNSLNIRSGAGVSHSVVGAVKKGQVFTIVQTTNGWGKLKSGAGWINVSSAYVKNLGAVKQSPTVTPPVTKPPVKEEAKLELNQAQREELSKIFKKARTQGLFSSDEHEKNVLNGTMTVSQAVYLVAIIATGERLK